MLVGEPFSLRPWEIAKLTPYQVRRIYFHPREKDGQIKHERQGSDQTYQEIFWNVYRQLGMEEHRIKAKWQAYLKEQKGK